MRSLTTDDCLCRENEVRRWRVAGEKDDEEDQPADERGWGRAMKINT